MPQPSETPTGQSVVYTFASAKMYLRLAKENIERIAQMTGSARETEIAVACHDEAEAWLTKHIKAVDKDV